MRKSSQKRHKVQQVFADRISELPDDILISIISRLPLQEASATSFLSTRWRYLCTYVTRLNFPPFKPRINERSDVDVIATRSFPRYAAMIDRTLDSNRGNRVKELRVNTYCINGANLEKWLEFAFTRAAQIIEINMTKLRFGPVCSYSLALANSIWMKPASAAGLKCLKELSLSMIDVTDQDIELLISNCLALESLSIGPLLDHYLTRVSIVGHSNLRHLDMYNVWIPESFEIRDVINLVSLKCCLQHGCALQLENIPKLVEFSNGEHYIGIPHAQLFAKIPSCIRDQLQLLHFSTRLFKMELFVQPFEFVNAKYLELEVVDFRDAYYVVVNVFPRWIVACPSLEKLKIKLLWDKWSRRESSWEKGEPITLTPHMKKIPRCWTFPPNLKELEITGYLGSQSIVQVASYIINSAASLEQLIVVPCDSSRTNRIRTRRDFQPITPCSVNLKII